MLITSLDNEKIKNYNKLKDKKFRDKTGKFLVEGYHLVFEAYKAGLVDEIILEQDEVIPLEAPKVYVTNEIINRLSDVETPSKVMALCHKKEEQTELGNHILILDGVQDPGNLGTIIRSSKAFHVDTIVLSESTVDPYNAKVIRSTQGMLFHTNIIRRDLVTFIEELKKDNYPIYGTQVTHGRDVRSLSEKDTLRYVLIMGNEGNGVRDEILDLCDDFLYITMDESVESLNVGVATSILLYELDLKKTSIEEVQYAKNSYTGRMQ